MEVQGQGQDQTSSEDCSKVPSYGLTGMTTAHWPETGAAESPGLGC